MKKIFKCTAKFFVFFAILYAVMLFLAFVLKNDSDSYCRILMHELHNQEKIDVLICGASKVPHGIYPDLAEELTGEKFFCTGTPGQTIDGTFAIIREASSLYKIKQIFLEMDFAVAIKEAPGKRKGLKNTYLVSEYLKNPKIKFDFLRNASSPSLYLNSLCPIGKEKYIELDPHTVAKNLKSKISGEYFKYAKESAGSNYAGKGCVMEKNFVKEGTFFSAREDEIPLEKITDEYKRTLVQIAEFCRENGIQLTLFYLPESDFYLTQKKNFDEYLDFQKEFISSAEILPQIKNFTLCRDEFLKMTDEDFTDQTHMSQKGCIKFTEFFCKFFYGGKINESEVFYESFAEKISAQNPKIYGIEIDKNQKNGEVKFFPVANPAANPQKITHDVFIESGGKKICIQKNSRKNSFTVPSGDNVGRGGGYNKFNENNHPHVLRRNFAKRSKRRFLSAVGREEVFS